MKPPIRWRLHLPTAPENVYELLATDRGRKKFWAQDSREENGTIRFEFINGQSITSQITENLPPSRFALTYFDHSEVRFKLTSDGRGGTDLFMEETGVPEATWHENYAGWLCVLLNLKAAVLGLDLRNHDPLRTWDQGYVDV